jgi:hypothetical protein
VSAATGSEPKTPTSAVPGERTTCAAPPSRNSTTPPRSAAAVIVPVRAAAETQTGRSVRAAAGAFTNDADKDDELLDVTTLAVESV